MDEGQESYPAIPPQILHTLPYFFVEIIVSLNYFSDKNQKNSKKIVPYLLRNK